MPESNGDGKRLWPIILSAVSVSFVLLTGAITFISQIAGLSNQATRQAGDIAALQSQLSQVNERQNNVRSRLDIVETAQKETDTQLCAMDELRNLMHANDLRLESVMWRKLFDIPIPTDNAYYPSLCAKASKSAP